jgi:hypothetical protein
MQNNLSIGLSILKKNIQTKTNDDEHTNNTTINNVNDFLNSINIDMNNKLNNTYNVWFHDANNTDFSINSFYNIAKFDNIKDYLIINQTLRNNYKMLLNGMFFIMKDEIKPLWNDDSNRDGGCISWKIDKHDSLNYWENLLLLLITNNLPLEFNKYGINGISINPKKNCNIIKVWLSKDIDGGILNKIDLTDKCLFRNKLKLYKSFKKFL